MRGYYKVNLTMAGNANFSVKRMDIPLLNPAQASTGLDGTYYASEVMKSAYGPIIKNAAVSQVTTWFGAYYGQLFSGIITGVGYVAMAQTLLIIASQNNVQSREYIAFIPTSTDYYFDFFFPGDIDHPTSMAKIFKCNEDGTQPLVFSHEDSYGSSAHITKKIHLTRGIHRINVSIGSGSLYFHTAGTCDGARLDSLDYVEWVEPNFPVTSQDYLLLSYLPNVGDTCSITLNTQLPPKPQEIRDGTVFYSDIVPVSAVFTPDRTNAYLRRDFYAEPTEEELAELGTWPSLNMKAVMVGSPINTGVGGTWTIVRQPDYTTNTVIKAIYHVY
ncbi:MAG: hypothetical protein Q8K40_05415 [Ignavibacteria bacterium]|nr:hypothetical protein [Ignavibacteria bacterium]